MCSNNNLYNVYNERKKKRHKEKNIQPHDDDAYSDSYSLDYKKIVIAWYDNTKNIMYIWFDLP